MSGSGLISVIIPVFNVRPYLTEALESVIRQTYSNLEIIVIDDGSTDGSGVICDDFAKRDDRIKMIHQENRGLSSARNADLEIMTGEAVAFLDPDDSLHPDYIKVMVETMEREKADIVVCKFTVTDPNRKSIQFRKKPTWPSINAGLYGRNDALRALVGGKLNVSVWNKLYRSKLWEYIRFPDGHNYEDMDIMFRVFDVCESVVVVDQPLYYHLRRPGSITDTASESNLRDIILARQHFEEFVRANTPSVFSFEELNRARQAAFNGMLISYVRYSGKKYDLGKDFLDRLRTQTIETGEALGSGSMDLRRKTAYAMMRTCPALLKISYPAYRAVRKLINEITGR